MKKYQVTKKFISGLLKGLTYREITSVNFKLGKKYGNYIIIDIYSIRENWAEVTTAKTIKEAKNKIDKIITQGYC